ncbi:replication initiation protein [Clostridium tertium]|jgi:plasmid replication initiation protein|uniref:replication initiation protein n=1 Tax=Clostridium tertium TaxID=1559 RepID=UPI0023B27AC6|nr:replication initiation protein [Clostridium tertium]
MDGNYLVTKSNYFIMNSSYDLSLEEQKIILTLASMVQPSDEDFKPYQFRIVDFMKLLGVENQSKYTEIPKITKELMKKVFEIVEGKKVIQIAWLSSATYEKGTGMVELEFSPKLKPYMLKLNTMFTQYKLVNILSMKSKYSPRIYEILKCNEFKKQGYVEIEINELRKLLKADNIYPLYADFKRKVIIQTQNELKKISDISFDFEEIKTGRKVTSLKFYIHSNSSKKLNNKNTIEVIDEVSATVSEEIEVDKISEIKNIIKTICNKNIKDKTANEFYQIALNNKDFNKDPLALIKEIANYSKTQDVKNFNGWFKTMLKDYEKPTKSHKQLKFNNFKGRDYDYDDLERKLLGWD